MYQIHEIANNMGKLQYKHLPFSMLPLAHMKPALFMVQKKEKPWKLGNSCQKLPGSLPKWTQQLG